MRVWAQVDIEFITRRGLTVPDDYAEAISSMNFTRVAEYTIERFGLTDSPEDLLREWTELAAYAYANTVSLKPGAREYLASLREKGAKLAIATSTLPRLCRLALEKHNITDWFDVICNSEEVGVGKSRPDVFLLAAERLGVSPEDCVVFEDILPAVKAAKSVSMTVCGVYDETSREDWGEITKISDYFIHDFVDIVGKI
jgi:HAD superfamily hydrolase (TIGR01509 family)